MIIDENMLISENSKLNEALRLDSSNFEYKQVVGFKDFLVFSDCIYPEPAMGRVVVVYKDTFEKEILGLPGQYLGEYLFISEDSPGGNIVVGISQKEADGRDKYDHIYLYKLLESSPTDLEWFEYADQVQHTMMTPRKGSLREISDTRDQKLSASFAYGSFLSYRVDRNYETKHVKMCGRDEFYMNGKCSSCSDPEAGTVDFQSMKCKSCGDMWFDTKDDAEESMESLIAKQICENPRSVYYGDDEVVEPEEKEVVEEPIVEPEP